MKKKQSIFIISFIVLLAMSTFALQFYWNVQNFENSKKATEEEIKTLFEQSITQYFEEQSKRDVVSFLSEEIKFSTDDFMTAIRIDTIFQKTIEKVKIKTDSVQQKPKSNTLKSFHFESASSETKLPAVKDSLLYPSISEIRDSFMKPQILVLKGQKAIDSLGDLTRFKNRIVISMSRDSLDYKQLDSK
jgi:flagellar basal body-associated protein FliL